MPPRLFKDRPQTGSERARRSREAREEYIRALERLAVDAAPFFKFNDRWWNEHYDTIQRARASISGRRGE